MYRRVKGRKEGYWARGQPECIYKKSMRKRGKACKPGNGQVGLSEGGKRGMWGIAMGIKAPRTTT